VLDPVNRAADDTHAHTFVTLGVVNLRKSCGNRYATRVHSCLVCMQHVSARACLLYPHCDTCTPKYILVLASPGQLMTLCLHVFGPKTMMDPVKISCLNTQAIYGCIFVSNPCRCS
jgi:hypothetical protein